MPFLLLLFALILAVPAHADDSRPDVRLDHSSWSTSLYGNNALEESNLPRLQIDRSDNDDDSDATLTPDN